MVPAAAVGEAQPHLPSACVVVGDVDVPHTPRVRGIAAGPALQFRVDATIRATNIDRLALRVKRHAPRARDAGVTDA